jgi:hypothetical protein
MSRTYAKMFVDIWEPASDFRDLTEGPQRLYAMMFSHPRLSAAGVLPLQTRHWAGLAKGLTVAKVERYLAELEAHPSRKVIIDRDTEEVFVRAYIRRDGGANNTNIAKAIRKAIDHIESDTLRAAAEAEFERARQAPSAGSNGDHP